MINPIMLRALRVAPAVLLSLAATAGAQSIASRVAAAGAGEVRMTYATRSGVCGDGRDVVGMPGALYVGNSMESFGHWSGARCQPGAARVTLRTGAGGVESVRTRVGGGWESATGRVTDLGVVPAPQAAQYFLDLAEKLDGKAARNVMLAAVIADSADINQRLLRLAQNRSAPGESRKRAAAWLGMLGDASYVEPLTALARSDSRDDGVAGAATMALGQLPDGVGIPSLIGIAHDAASSDVRERAVFWLGQSDDARARREVRTIAADPRAAESVRAKAVFALAHGDAATPEDFAFIRGLFDKVGDSEKIQNQILMAMSQSDDPANGRWLLDVARDERASSESRKKAIFWAGQGGAASTADIAAVYDAARDEAVKEHTIFVLSQRDDQAATDKLLAIVHGRDDPELRKKALFWLAQKHDPKVTAMISDMINKP